MPSRVKKSKCLARLSDDRGQAAIEYVLLLIIAVSMVLALVYQIFKPMQKYMDAYLGTYVGCLLETGGLPSFGGDETSAKDMGCAIAQFENADGKGGGSKGSNGKGGSGSDEGGGSNSSSNSSSGGSDSGGGGSSGGGGGRGGAGSRGLRQARHTKGAAGIEGGQQGGKVVEIALDGNGSGSFFGGRGSSYSVQARRKVSAVNMSGWTEAERKKVEKKDDTGRTKVIATDDMGPAPKKMMVKKPEAKVVLEEEKEQLTVGNFIRYLFIAALIIALVIFIGGQALSMSKGDKE